MRMLPCEEMSRLSSDATITSCETAVAITALMSFERETIMPFDFYYFLFNVILCLHVCSILLHVYSSFHLVIEAIT